MSALIPGKRYTFSGGPSRMDRPNSVFEQIMDFLGLGPGEFDLCESNRFLLSPRGWLDQQLKKVGYVRVTTQKDGAPPCPRACCQETK